MIVVLGASGMLGSALTKELKEIGWESACYSHQGLDVSSELSIRKLFKAKKKPDLIINCAAITNVDACEQDPFAAHRVNSFGVGVLAKICKQHQTKFIQISTDYVFDGKKKTPYIETDETNPLQDYGRSKLGGEALALEYGGFVFRIQWVYGQGRKNFTDWVIESSLGGKKIPISVDQSGIPSSTLWLSKQIVVASHKLTTPGIYHLAHDNFCTRMEFAEYIARGLGKNPSDIIDPLVGTNFGIAKRPLNTVLGNAKIMDSLGLKTMGTWQMDLDHYIRNSWKVSFIGK